MTWWIGALLFLGGALTTVCVVFVVYVMLTEKPNPGVRL